MDKHYNNKYTHIGSDVLLGTTDWNTTPDSLVCTGREYPIRFAVDQNTRVYDFLASAVIPKMRKKRTPKNTLLHSIHFTPNTSQMFEFQSLADTVTGVRHEVIKPVAKAPQLHSD